MSIDQAGAYVDVLVWQVFSIGTPILGAIALTGLMVAVLQAASQIQESSLVFLPKLGAVMTVAVLGFQWAVDRLVSYFISIADAIGSYGVGG